MATARMTRFFLASLLVLLSWCFLVPPVMAQSPDAGFLDRPLWFSKDSFAAGETVRIYTAVWNGGTDALLGTAHFFDKDTLIGTRDFSVSPGSVEDVSVSWTAVAGDHQFSVRLVDARFAGGGPAIDLASSETGSVSRIVPPAASALPELSLEGAGEAAEAVLEEQIGKAESFIVGLVGDTVMASLSDTFSGVETFRQERIVTVAEKKGELSASLGEDASEEASAPDGEISGTSIGSLERPFKQVYLFFLALLSFIYAHALIFYALLAYLAFIILRFLYRRFRS